MRFKIFQKVSRRHIQGVALIVLGGMVAGCSSDTMRFTDGLFTGSTPAQQAVTNRPMPQQQQMPPAVRSGSVQSSELPPVAAPAQSAGISNQPGTLGTLPVTSSNNTNTRTASAPAANNSSYIVQSGDTLTAISRRTGVSISALKNANGLTSGGIRVGQKLIVPGGNSNTQVARAAPLQATPAAMPKVETPKAQPAVETKVVESVAIKAPTSEPAVAKPDDSMQKAEQVAVIAPQATGISQMRWPVRGRILSSFGQRDGTVTNDGLDIMVPEGTSVKAAENGVVIYAGDGLKEFGNTVLVRHENNIVTVYGHNSKLMVQRGQKVQRGDEIAKSGMSGKASTPKLHFEVRKNSAPTNPVKYLEN